MEHTGKTKSIGLGRDEANKPSAVRAAGIRWDLMPVDELLRNRNAIDEALPSIELKDLDLEKELLLQFHSVRKLQDDVLHDDTIQLNQRAQLANTVASVLTKLADLQVEVYSAERFKSVENLLIRHLMAIPEAVAVAFLAEYRELLQK